MLRRLLLTASAVATALTMNVSVAGAESTTDGVVEALKASDFYTNARYRFEHVDQDGFANNANASTLRIKTGVKTGVYEGFQALLEAELSANLGDENYNDTVNGNTTFPVVIDPDNLDANQFWLSYSGIPYIHAKAGRQAINLDNQRWVGTVGFRQNDQTFDAVAVALKPLEGLSFEYTYMWNVNRIFGDDHPLGDLSSENHIARAQYQLDEWLKLTGYAYLFEFDRLAARSTETYGVRAEGKYAFDELWTLIYEAEYAQQSDRGNNTTDFDGDYMHFAPGVKVGNWTFKAGYESLEGDGTSAVQTTLATLHKFNGWADIFAAGTPVDGLEDYYLVVKYKASGINEYIDGTKFMAVFHHFEAEDSSADYGDEINLKVSRSVPLPDFFDKGVVSLKYADYDADEFSVDTRKFWFTLKLVSNQADILN